jgi:hypothetical protein
MGTFLRILRRLEERLVGRIHTIGAGLGMAFASAGNSLKASLEDFCPSALPGNIVLISIFCIFLQLRDRRHAVLPRRTGGTS